MDSQEDHKQFDAPRSKQPKIDLSKYLSDGTRVSIRAEGSLVTLRSVLYDSNSLENQAMGEQEYAMSSEIFGLKDRLTVTEASLAEATARANTAEELLDKLTKQANEVFRIAVGWEKRATKAEVALRRIEKWFGEFPETGEFWDQEKQRPKSYATCYGSNGERDFMRGIAREALKGV